MRCDAVFRSESVWLIVILCAVRATMVACRRTHQPTTYPTNEIINEQSGQGGSSSSEWRELGHGGGPPRASRRNRHSHRKDNRTLQMTPSACLQLKCRNGGRCVVVGDSALEVQGGVRCQCPLGTTGSSCEKRKQPNRLQY